METQLNEYNKVKLSEVLANEQLERQLHEQQEAEKKKAFDSDDECNLPFIDDDNEDETYLDNAIAHEQWKVREITRLKRDQDERQRYQFEKEEVERRRNMTEQERLEEDERNGHE